MRNSIVCVQFAAQEFCVVLVDFHVCPSHANQVYSRNCDKQAESESKKSDEGEHAVHDNHDYAAGNSGIKQTDRTEKQGQHQADTHAFGRAGDDIFLFALHVRREILIFVQIKDSFR